MTPVGAWRAAAMSHPACTFEGAGSTAPLTISMRWRRRFPENVTIYRKPLDEFWDGKREMVNAPLPNITEPCLLWQVDSDELWTVEQIHSVHALFTKNPSKTAAYYWC